MQHYHKDVRVLPDLTEWQAVLFASKNIETVKGNTKDHIAVDYAMRHLDASMAAVYRQGIEDQRKTSDSDHVREWLRDRKNMPPLLSLNATSQPRHNASSLNDLGNVLSQAGSLSPDDSKNCPVTAQTGSTK
jgi:hypothetical protein